jgi:hypothetical protein
MVKVQRTFNSYATKEDTMRYERIYTDEGYRIWRQEWRAKYKELSLLIRKMKNTIRDLQREGIRASQLQSDLSWRRKEAREMMQEFEEAKEYKRLISKKAA